MKVKIHGILGKTFGSFLKINCSELKFLINAIDSVKNGFRKKIIELSKKNFHYTILFNKKNNEFEFVPVIGGAGKYLSFIFSAVLIVVGVILIMTGFPQVGWFLVKMGISTFVSSAISLMMSQKTTAENPGEISVGGAFSELQGLSKSYIFSNNYNTASQGSIVSFGYGKLKVASNVIGASLKSYPVNLSLNQVVSNRNQIEIYD